MEQERNAEYFRSLGLSSFVYALVYTACMYKNNVGIALLFCVGATIFYAQYVLQKANYAIKKDSAFMIVVMLLLGISTFSTGNATIQFLNRVGLFLTLILFLLHNIYNDNEWGFIKSVGEIAKAVFGAMVSLADPIWDGKDYFSKVKDKKNDKTAMIIIGLVISIPCVVVLGGCLATADAVFAQMLTFNLSAPELFQAVFVIPFMIAFGFFASYCGMRFLLKKGSNESNVELQKHNPIIAITFTSIISVMYVAFCVIQIVYLFLGFGELPHNMTYATYARTGFFQLLFVVVVNVVMVLVVKNVFEKSKVLQFFLYTICACTLIMIASSAYRMILYIGAYQLTFLRVFVLVCLAAIAFVMLGLLVYMQNDKFPLFRFTFIVVSVCYVSFSLSHVDYWIASYNVNHVTKQHTKEMQWYLSSLSTDAAPVIEQYLNGQSTLKNELDSLKARSKDYSDEYDRRDMWESSDLSWYYLYVEDNYKYANNKNIRKFNISNYYASRLEMFQKVNELGLKK